jgi:hypothetical protein
MATKSVGTLAAKLLLDTKGWLSGFASANKTADKFSKTMATKVGSAIEKTALKFFTIEKIMRATRVGFRALGDSMARIEKAGGLLDVNKDAAQSAAAVQSLGIALSSMDTGNVARLNSLLRETQAIGMAITDTFVAQMAPGINQFMNDWLIGIGLINRQMEAGKKSSKPLLQQSLMEMKTLDFLPAAIAKLTGAKGSIQEIADAMEKQRLDANKVREAVRAAVPAAVVKAVAPPKVFNPRSLSGTQDAHERGTLGAAQAVQALGGDAIRSVDENTARMLEQIKGLRTDLKSGRKIVQAKI